MTAGGLEQARAEASRICALAGEGRPESLAASAALLENAAAGLAPYAPELLPELMRLGRLAGQAAAFYAHCLAPAGAAPGYTACGRAEAAPAPAQVLLEG